MRVEVHPTERHRREGTEQRSGKGEMTMAREHGIEQQGDYHAKERDRESLDD